MEVKKKLVMQVLSMYVLTAYVIYMYRYVVNNNHEYILLYSSQTLSDDD